MSIPQPGDKLREEAETLRRVASSLRASGQQDWRTQAIDLERIADEKETESYKLDSVDVEGDRE